MCPPCRRLAFIEDFEFLITVGVGWQEICQRLRSTPLSIDRKLARAERLDLAVVWRRQVRDGGTWEKPGWQAAKNQHAPKTARRNRNRVAA
jgi:hypothetical protein